MELGGVGVQAELLGESAQNLGARTRTDQVATVQVFSWSPLAVRSLPLGSDRDLQAARIERRLGRDQVTDFRVRERQAKIRVRRLRQRQLR